MGDIVVASLTQKIIVDPADNSVSVINAGPMGPAGFSDIPGPQGEQGEQGEQGIQGIQGIQGVPGTPALEAYRNLIDNGAMAVCQRATSLANIGGVSGVRVIDRWFVHVGSSNVARWTISQAVEAPSGSGLTNSTKYLCTTAAVPAAADYVIYTQSIEGQFLQHLLWGTALAKALTLSFWVKSNKTGTYIAEINIGSSRYGIPYTINVADVWEYKTITFPGNTVIVLTNDTANRLALQFWLQAGSTYSGGSSIPASWSAVENTRVVGGVNLGAAVNNYWQITGVQLEVGNAATPFEIRSYDREFNRCRRYFQRWNDPPLRGVFSAANSPSRMAMPLPVPMRSAPTATLSAAGVIGAYDGVNVATISSIDTQYSTPNHVEFNTTASASPFVIGRAALIYKSGAGYIDFNAEI